MWFGDRVRGRTQSDVFEGSYDNAREAVSDVMQSVKCYDMMRESGKVIVFENKISFQLAFYALVEHDIQVAPIWDPEVKHFVGLMTISDFIDATRAYKAQQRPIHELSSKTLCDMLTDSTYRIKFCEFQSIDAEDTAFQASSMLRRLDCEYIPVLDPDEGNLLATLGYFDVFMVIVETSKRFPHLFTGQVSTHFGAFGGEVITAPKTTPLGQVLALIDEKQISAIPVTDENGIVIGLYHKDDVTFLATAEDVESNMTNLDLTVGDILATPVEHTTMNVLCTYAPTDTLLQVLHRCAETHSSRAVCVDEEGHCIGVISIKDLVAYFMQS